ncbi:hypothetical protein N431DRAFT_442123 [Stipitochalara longipes BDJ]|nr:hypothetical protein N431DRAFT_442123 [Stipitochalara longipes BDJ]
MSTQNSFLQESVQFLKTKTPTDELDDPIHINNMPKVEQWVLEVKKRWLATPYPKQLAAIISRVIEDRQDEPIYNAICLGMSGDYPAWEVQQFVVFSQIMAQLATANPDLLNNILFQDPIARPYWKEVVQNHGCQVVETPAAFMEVGKSTFVFSPWTGDMEYHLRSMITSQLLQRQCWMNTFATMNCCRVIDPTG